MNVNIGRCLPPVRPPQLGLCDCPRLVREFKDPVEVIDPGNIKIVVGLNGYSLYASRSPVPYPQKTAKFTYKKYVGVELFNKPALEFYVTHEQTEIEKIEDIGSIRFFEHGIRIHYDLVESNSLSVDTPRDLEKIREIMTTRVKAEVK